MLPTSALSKASHSRGFLPGWLHLRTAGYVFAVVCCAHTAYASSAATESEPATAAAAETAQASAALAEVNQLIVQGKLTEAAALAQVHLSRNKHNVQMRFLQGVIATEQKKYDVAIEVFTALTRDFPSLSEPYNNLAVLYASRGEMQKATQMLEQATRINPGYATAYANLGDLYVLMASDSYFKASQLDSNRADLQPKLALIQQIPLNNNGNSPTRSVLPSSGQSSVKISSASAAISPNKSKNITDMTPHEGRDSTRAAGTDDNNQQIAVTAIEKAVDAWAQAWASKDMNRYYAAYSANFVPLKGDINSWKAERRNRITSKKSITLNISNLKVTVNGARATARFLQDYSADGYKDRTVKTLEMRYQNNQWLIVNEKTTS